MGTTHELRGRASLDPPTDEFTTVRLVYELLREEGFAIELEPNRPGSVTLVHLASRDAWTGFGTGACTSLAAVDALERFYRLSGRLAEPVQPAPPHLRLV